MESALRFLNGGRPDLKILIFRVWGGGGGGGKKEGKGGFFALKKKGVK